MLRPETPHAHVVEALAEVLEIPVQTEHDALIAMLRRTDTPYRALETHDGAIRLVKVADVALFVFDQGGRCGRVLTEP